MLFQATSEQYAVDDFTGFLLRMLHYDEIDGVDGLAQMQKVFFLHGEEGHWR